MSDLKSKPAPVTCAEVIGVLPTHRKELYLAKLRQEHAELVVTVAGLDFTRVPMDDFVAFYEEYRKELDITSGRILALIQDKNTGRYELKTSQTFAGLTMLKLISRGKCSLFLQRKYGSAVLKNINVWISVSRDGIYETHVLRALSGQWIDEPKEELYAKREADRYIRREPSAAAEYKQKFPLFFAKMAKYEPLEEHIAKELNHG